MDDSEEEEAMSEASDADNEDEMEIINADDL